MRLPATRERVFAMEMSGGRYALCVGRVEGREIAPKRQGNTQIPQYLNAKRKLQSWNFKADN
jgi:hypothetical protein